MPALVAGIHVLIHRPKTWMAGTRPGHDVGIGSYAGLPALFAASPATLFGARRSPSRSRDPRIHQFSKKSSIDGVPGRARQRQLTAAGRSSHQELVDSTAQRAGTIISSNRIITFDIKWMTPMLDKPGKTYELIDILEAAVPFEVILTPGLVEHLARQEKPVAVKSIETVSKISYLGDAGGIMCHIQPEDVGSALVISLSHVRVRRTLPFAGAVFDYQKHRVKKLKKQTGMSGRGGYLVPGGD